MKSDSHLVFEEYRLSYDRLNKKTRRYCIKSSHNREILGKIEWQGSWRQYVAESEEGIIWSSGCLQELSEFLDKLNKEHKLKWQTNN